MSNELIIKAGGKAYRATFSRPLSDDEARRVAAMNFAGSVSTLADVRKVVEAALAVLNIRELQ